jgi:hypothetical protein
MQTESLGRPFPRSGETVLATETEGPELPVKRLNGMRPMCRDAEAETNACGFDLAAGGPGAMIWVSTGGYHGEQSSPPLLDLRQGIQRTRC